MYYWGINKLKDPNSNHILRKVEKRRRQLLEREQTKRVIKELKDLDKRERIGRMLLAKWYETHLDNRLDTRQETQSHTR